MEAAAAEISQASSLMVQAIQALVQVAERLNQPKQFEVVRDPMTGRVVGSRELQ